MSKYVVFLCEEESASVFIEGIVKRLSPTCLCYFIYFEGKRDLDKQLEHRIKNWKMPDTRFVILRDQDSGDCIQIKFGLREKCALAGKANDCVVRIACSELESFYLGDLAAVERALGTRARGVAAQQNKSKYRTPDDRNNACDEFERLVGSYAHISDSRIIAKEISLDVGVNKSHSYNVLLKTLCSICSA